MLNTITTLINVTGAALLLILAYYMTVLITRINGHIKVWYMMPAIFVLFSIFRMVSVIDAFFDVTDTDLVAIGSLIVPIIWFALIVVTRKTTKEIANLHVNITDLETNAELLKTEAKVQHSEDIRQIAESARQTAEHARQVAEASRAYAENIRTEIFTKLKSLFEKL
jgi:F0F1-type ATP synthase membrane subunit b/b'